MPKLHEPRPRWGRAGLRIALLGLCAALSLSACSDPSAPPPAAAQGAACRQSFECPSGTHCDLEACYQACNTETRCPGGLACTPRGRCASSAGADEPSTTASVGLLRVEPTSVIVPEGADHFDLVIRGEGRVRYRVASDAAWVAPTAARAEFQEAVRISVPVSPATATTPNALVTVYSDQGDVRVLVSTVRAAEGVWRGQLAFDHVRVPRGGSTESVAVDLGATAFDVHLASGAGGLLAMIDPTSSTLWTASPTNPVRGTGTVNGDGTTTLSFATRVDASAAASRLPESPSVFGARAIGRELELTLTRTPEGTLTGTATERIHGLTGTPVELTGTVRLVLDTHATVAAIAAPPAVTMPAGPARDVGAAPAGCPAPAAPAECLASATAAERWACIAGRSALDPRGAVQGVMATAFPLSAFYQPDLTPLFAFDPTTTQPGRSPYADAAAVCATELPGDYRIDTQSGGPFGCVDLRALDCARYLAGTNLDDAPPLRLQGAMYVARAYLELFSLLGNEHLVTSYRTRLDPGAAAGATRTAQIEARRSFDAGLARVFAPALFEELRAASPVEAEEGPVAPLVVNDRIPLRRAAESWQRSVTATLDVLQGDLSTASDLDLLRTAAQRDATLHWLEAALLADLAARWSSADLPSEVDALGTLVRRLDERVRSIDPAYTPLGVARAYVPLLARTAPTDVQTNFERIFTLAQQSVALSTTYDATALASLRDFDREVTTAQSELEAEAASLLQQITADCGAAFVSGDAVNPDFEACGLISGAAADTAFGVRTAYLDWLAAVDALAAHQRLYESRRNAYAAIYAVRSDQLALVTRTNATILDISETQAYVDSAADALDAAGDFEVERPWSAAKMGAAGLRAYSRQLELKKQKLEQFKEVSGLRADLQTLGIEQAQDLYEAALQFAQLDLQVQIKANEYARARVALDTHREQIEANLAAYAAAREALARPLVSDPSFRIVRDSDVLRADRALAQAKLDLYYAARALEYETNSDLAPITRSIFTADSAADLADASTCLTNAWNQWRLLVTSSNTYTTEVSLREHILGITGDVRDPVTGERISAGEQFRRYLFDQPYAPDSLRVWPALRFATTLDPRGALFSALLCNDRITGIEAQVVGTRLRSGAAELRVLVDGASTVRSCATPTGTADALVAWNLRPRGSLAAATVQASVNAYPATAPNQSLLHYSVAQATWVVAVPDATTSPANAGLDLDDIDDIVLRVTHSAIAAGGATGNFSPTCN